MDLYKTKVESILFEEAELAEGKPPNWAGIATSLVIFGGALAVGAPSGYGFLEKPMFVDMGDNVAKRVFEVNLDVLGIQPGSSIKPSEAYTELYLKACAKNGKDPVQKPYFELVEPELYWRDDRGKSHRVFYGHDFFYYKEGKDMFRIPARDGLSFIGA